MKSLIIALLFLPAHEVSAQQQRTTQTETIETLLARIERLERRLAELEGSRVQAEPAAQRAEPAQAPAQVLHPEVVVPAASEGPSLKIAGFSDFNFSGSDQKGTKSGFTEGQFVLHLNSNLTQKVSFMGELSLTARTDAGSGMPPVTGFNAEVERSIIRFEHNDYLKVSFGRYHTPINWWNTAFHHGQWLQTTISRPEMVQFGGRFIPVHFVGALVEGGVPAGGWNLNYQAGVGNGRGSVINRANDAGDNNARPAWLGKGFTKPDGAVGVQGGGSRDFGPITHGR